MSAEQDFIERIHSAGRSLVIAATGGGSGAISALLKVPGASASVLEAIVPYAASALDDWLGGTVDHYCSERTARAMAMASFERARKLSGSGPRMLRGIGCTASLATTRPKRGPHRIHVAWQSAETTVAVTCELIKGQRKRVEEEQIASELVLDAVGEACGIERRRLNASISDSVNRREQRAPREWTELLLGQRQSIAIGAAGAASAGPHTLFPGAFNPLHSGHEQMAAVAAVRCGCPVTFELSIANVDKPTLDFIEIADRVSQFQDDCMLLTRAATFVEKAQIAPGCVFIVGVDTLVRIGDPRYYGGEPAHCDLAIAAIATCGCRFLVFGRKMESGFRTLSDFSVPPALRALCDEVPEAQFRDDVSSTELRGA